MSLIKIDNNHVIQIFLLLNYIWDKVDLVELFAIGIPSILILITIKFGRVW